jgi:hypothetical protein
MVCLCWWPCRGGLKLLLMMRTESDKKLKQHALEGVFKILENDSILANESLDSEVSQLMLALSQYGAGAQVKKMASAIVVRLATNASRKQQPLTNPSAIPRPAPLPSISLPIVIAPSSIPPAAPTPLTDSAFMDAQTIAAAASAPLPPPTT